MLVHTSRLCVHEAEGQANVTIQGGLSSAGHRSRSRAGDGPRGGAIEDDVGVSSVHTLSTTDLECPALGRIIVSGARFSPHFLAGMNALRYSAIHSPSVGVHRRTEAVARARAIGLLD